MSIENCSYDPGLLKVHQKLVDMASPEADPAERLAFLKELNEADKLATPNLIRGRTDNATMTTYTDHAGRKHPFQATSVQVEDPPKTTQKITFRRRKPSLWSKLLYILRIRQLPALPVIAIAYVGPGTIFKIVGTPDRIYMRLTTAAGIIGARGVVPVVQLTNGDFATLVASQLVSPVMDPEVSYEAINLTLEDVEERLVDSSKGT